MLNTLLSTTQTMPVGITQLIFSLLIALLLGMMISITHTKSHPTSKFLDNFSVTLIMLPAVVAMIILLIGSDIARAFSLAGAFSIIRFRSAPGNPKDITFVLLSMATGLAVGTEMALYAVIFDTLLCAVLLAISFTKTVIKNQEHQKLMISIPEDMEYHHNFSDILSNYTAMNQLVGVKTAALGSLYQLNYMVILKDASKAKEMIDELRVRNGNLNISLSTIQTDNDSFY
ncbi:MULTISPECIES: DUF4956 domain-containing protein [unclassified Fusibacter]|uniref:DUF4956 domain-containing protein n=1 Tax=unclassified Fusibacter TaxID=2624464 RepID=UPI0013E8F6B8|nr:MULTISPECIES: DUF4956 domain-containing protein [unclassified Fusibacter]MCK8060202.1 DUF4956 domain-containing protein [Fusibacter sp. A2]NPE22342.1 DUF4956 domain-containing protein [Fusibacter sp. A1]